MLKVSNLNVYYDAIHALKDVSFDVAEGEIVTLIGANGAGKTSILHAISGLIRAKSGRIVFLDQEIQSVPAHELVTRGLAQVPEGRRIFSKMTVLENLEMGAYARKDRSHLSDEMNRVFQSFPRLKERRKQLAGTLSGGEQQMLAMGRALMSSPKLLLLDEPSMGLSPILVGEIFSIIKEINASGMTVLLVEQNARMALSVAQRAYVMETGKIVMQGPAKELLGNEEVKKAYLGS
jgi:ABC-type branched-chain amino acid transport systems, ATPase component